MYINGNLIGTVSGGSSGGTTALNYMGVYNATTNIPALANGVGTNGEWYYTTVAGTNNPTGANLAVGQSIIYNSALGLWQAGTEFASNTNGVVVDASYAPIANQQVSSGEVLTLALGQLQGQINALAGSAPLTINSNTTISTSTNLLLMATAGITATIPLATAWAPTPRMNSQALMIQNTSLGSVTVTDGALFTYTVLAGSKITLTPTLSGYFVWVYAC